MSGREPRRFTRCPRNVGADGVKSGEGSVGSYESHVCVRAEGKPGELKRVAGLAHSASSSQESKNKREKKRVKRVTFRAPGDGPAVEGKINRAPEALSWEKEIGIEGKEVTNRAKKENKVVKASLPSGANTVWRG